jgi:hypothetical protein
MDPTGLMRLRRPRLSRHPADATLRNPQPLLDVADCPPSARRARSEGAGQFKELTCSGKREFRLAASFALCSLHRAGKRDLSLTAPRLNRRDLTPGGLWSLVWERLRRRQDAAATNRWPAYAFQPF